jgi:hypothetical protein
MKFKTPTAEAWVSTGTISKEETIKFDRQKPLKNPNPVAASSEKANDLCS